MNELLKIEINDNQEQTVSGRELYAFLGIAERFSKWWDRMIGYGFTENIDFTSVQKSTVVNNGAEKPITDYIMKLDMAKELCMLARNEKGKQARHYFLEVEREWNSPEKVMARALVIANNRIETLALENTMQKQVIAEFKPIKEYVDTILASEDTLSITQIAADYGMSAKSLNKILNEEKIIHNVSGQWILYKKHMNKGYTRSETLEVNRKDGSKKVVMQTRWTQKGRLKIHELLTALGYKANMDKEQGKNLFQGGVER